jgi:hypothetical protein
MVSVRYLDRFRSENELTPSAPLARAKKQHWPTEAGRSGVEEVFDVQVLPRVRRPLISGPFADQDGGKVIWTVPESHEERSAWRIEGDRCQGVAHFPQGRDKLLLPNGLRNDDIGEPGSGAILATHNPNSDPELNKYNKDRITQDAGCARSVGSGMFGLLL